MFRLTWSYHQNKNSQLKLEDVYCHPRQNPPFASTNQKVSTETQNCNFTFGFALVSSLVPYTRGTTYIKGVRSRAVISISEAQNGKRGGGQYCIKEKLIICTHNSVEILTSLWAGWRLNHGSSPVTGKGFLSLFTEFKLVTALAHPTTQSVSGAKQQGSEGDRPPPSTA
jgi:hypothetical protein